MGVFNMKVENALKELSLINLDDLRCFINGEWKKAEDCSTIEIINPSNEEVLAKVPNASRSDANEAIEAAANAFPKWSGLTANERGSFLLKLRDLLLKYEQELASIISLEMGKVKGQALGEVQQASSFLTWYAEEGRRIYGETIPASSSNKRLFVIKQPIGVVAAITPWNFPLSMLTRKLAPALAAGCATILKPAEQGSLTALAFAKLVELAKFPQGVINIVTGMPESISDEIFENPIVKKVSFTGSTRVGRILVKKSAQQLKKLSLELGGHAPFIVFEDADIQKAVEGAIESKYRNVGQTCICANRIYVHEKVKQEFTELFVSRIKQLSIGSGLDEGIEIGPLVNESALNKVSSHVKDSVEKGATIIQGGERCFKKKGYYFEPTVLTGVTNDMLIMSEETFGPVAPIIHFNNIEDVIAEANNTDYGLAAYVYTSNMEKAVRTAEALHFGIIGLNDSSPAVAQAPFGGIKQSGFGREGGHQGIANFLEEKFISLKV